MITTNRSIKSPKTARTKITPTDIAYAAGLIDGEGCVGIYLNSQNGNYQLRLSVEMTDKEGLLVLSGVFGGRWYYKKTNPPRKARYSWMLFNSEAANALIILLPYLRVKRKNAKLVLGADWFSFYKRKMTDKQRSIRKRIWLKNKQLNKRGT